MKNYLLTFIFTCFGFVQAPAQMETYNWHFGMNCQVSFVSGAPVFLPGCAIYNTVHQEGVASMSDAAGNILFYTDGATVWNRNNVIMSNGTGLSGHWSTSQSALIVPIPGSSNQYYNFTLEPWNIGNNRLYYSIIDMTLAGGLGDVTVKNVLVADSMTEKQIAIRHSNGTDFWLVTHKRLSNEFQCYLINASGISATPVINNTGTVIFNTMGIGCMKASRSGNKIACAYNEQSPGLFEIYDFDNSTGIISNSLSLQSPLYFRAYSVEFSPDGRFLYGSCLNSRKIYQFDIQVSLPVGVLVASTPVSVGDLLLAPDGKIYAAHWNYEYLGVINDPDSIGNACNFIANGFFLNGNLSSLGLPNFVHDLITITNIETPAVNTSFIIYPNPAGEYCELQIPELGFNNKYVLTLINGLGSTVFESELQNLPTSQEGSKFKIKTSAFPPGIYIIKIWAAQKGVFSQKLIIQ